MKKNVKYDANIQVNVKMIDENDNVKRSSTTLNYTLCNYFFGGVLFLDEKKPKNPSDYRKWLTRRVQDWVNGHGHIRADGQMLEKLMLRELYDVAYKNGRDDNSKNLSLEF